LSFKEYFFQSFRTNIQYASISYRFPSVHIPHHQSSGLQFISFTSIFQVHNQSIKIGIDLTLFSQASL